jgi:hypothetical protein
MPDCHRLPNPVKARLVRTVPLTFATVSQYRDAYLWTWTQFPDGSGYGATPDLSNEGAARYARRAARLGYASVDEFCFVHEFCHSFLAQELWGSASLVLWPLAHKRLPVYTAGEESLVLHFQEFMNRVSEDDVMEAADENVDWYGLRAKALSLLTLAADPVRDPAATTALR